MATSSQSLKVRVTSDTRSQFAAAARNRGSTESEFLRQLIARELTDQRATITEIDPKATASTRITVRMPEFLMAGVRDRAARAGLSPSRWITSLIQSNITRHPVLVGPELTLAESTLRELSAIGRNINQIARALNESSFQTDRVRLDRLAELRECIDRSRAEIREAIRTSRDAWSAVE